MTDCQTPNLLYKQNEALYKKKKNSQKVTDRVENET